MMIEEITIFCPATVANVGCGFDVLGFCLDTIGDEMVIRKTKDKGLRITRIEGYDLPFTISENVAGISAQAMYTALKPDCGFELEIYKRIKPGSGIGSSSASASGSVFGMNALLGYPLSKLELTTYAMKGEAFASKSEHADNLAPAIFGGFTLVKSNSPLKILELPTPDNLYATVIHPQIEVKTSESRALLPKNVPLEKAIKQWANVGSLVHGLHTEDYELIKEALDDGIVEPLRKTLIPGFDLLKSELLRAGALGCSISGSGPSVFALSKGEHMAFSLQAVMQKVYAETRVPFETYVSRINRNGIKILA